MDHLRIDDIDPFTAYLFFRRDSRRAATILLAEFRAHGGTLTPAQVHRISKTLSSGELGFKFTKTNFYGSVLKQLVGLGFVQKMEWRGRTGRREAKSYLAIDQPIAKRKPPTPSFYAVAWELCKRWNDLMFPQYITNQPAQEDAAA